MPRALYHTLHQMISLVVLCTLLLPAGVTNAMMTQPYAENTVGNTRSVPVAEGHPPPQSVELTYTTVQTLPQVLPYSLGYAVEVADGGDLPATAVIKVALPDGIMPEDPLTQQLVRLFYYQSSSETWQKLTTKRSLEGGVWYLQSPVTAPGIYAAALSTTPDYGDYQQPWQPGSLPNLY